MSTAQEKDNHRQLIHRIRLYADLFEKISRSSLEFLADFRFEDWKLQGENISLTLFNPTLKVYYLFTVSNDSIRLRLFNREPHDPISQELLSDSTTGDPEGLSNFIGVWLKKLNHSVMKALHPPKFEMVQHDFVLRNTSSVAYRIKALRDFGDVRAGDLGGYIETENMLSHEGNCWVYDSASVVKGGCVKGDAQVRDEAIIIESIIDGTSKISGKARISTSSISGQVSIEGEVHVRDSHVLGKVQLVGKICVSHAPFLQGDYLICGAWAISHTCTKPPCLLSLAGSDIVITDQAIRIDTHLLTFDEFRDSPLGELDVYREAIGEMIAAHQEVRSHEKI